MRLNFDHYQRKVDALKGSESVESKKLVRVNARVPPCLHQLSLYVSPPRASLTVSMSTGSPHCCAQNKGKLEEARRTYRAGMGAVMLVLRGVQAERWKDAQPVLLKVCVAPGCSLVARSLVERLAVLPTLLCPVRPCPALPGPAIPFPYLSYTLFSSFLAARFLPFRRARCADDAV